jgi:hypothetical protein
MKGGSIDRLVDQARARTKLIGVDELVHLINADAEIECQFIGELPPVLNIHAKQVAHLRIGIHDIKGGVDGSAGDRIDGEHGVLGGHIGALGA